MTRRLFLFSVSAMCVPSALRWIAMDSTGNILDLNWRASNNPASFGSLLKPFLALSYLATHAQAPMIECRGIGCWSPRGHGRQDLVTALANSCNVYFLQLAQTVNRAALDLTCVSYGLALPPRSWPASRLIGLGDGWPQIPLAVARAFASLARDRADSRVKLVLAGMQRCSQMGTAKQLGFPCYAKTGTAPCSDPRDGLGDGFVIAMYPLDQPRRIILLSRHNTTGAVTARSVKPLLQRWA